MTCLTTTTWQCPNGDTGEVPPGTECICNAFRHPGWIPNNQLLNPDGTTCTSGIVCVVEGGTQFRVCGVSDLQPVQDGRFLSGCLRTPETYRLKSCNPQTSQRRLFHSI
jgi:hypothetical protein